LWLFLAVIGHYLYDFTTQDKILSSSKVAFGVCLSGMLVYSWLLLRNLLTKEGRHELFFKRADLPTAPIFLRVVVCIVPVAALGALLAPLVIK